MVEWYSYIIWKSWEFATIFLLLKIGSLGNSPLKGKRFTPTENHKTNLCPGLPNAGGLQVQGVQGPVGGEGGGEAGGARVPDVVVVQTQTPEVTAGRHGHEEPLPPVCRDPRVGAQCQVLQACVDSRTVSFLFYHLFPGLWPNICVSLLTIISTDTIYQL